MKYLVMEVHPAYAVVLDEKGRFLKVANFRYTVGQTVESVEPCEIPDYHHTHSHHHHAPRWLGPTVAACILFVAVLFGVVYLTPHGTVVIREDFSVELTINAMDRVIGLTAQDEAGRMLIDGYSYFGEEAFQVARELTNYARMLDYLTTGDVITVTACGADAQWRLAQEGGVVYTLKNSLGDEFTILGSTDPLPQPSATASDPSSEPEGMSLDKATQIALDYLAYLEEDAVILDAELENDVYEVEILCAGQEFTFEIDATGLIIRVESEPYEHG